MKKYDLKPCPHCGGKAFLERRHRAFINAKTTTVAFVRCTLCNARSGRFGLEETGGTRNHSAAAEQMAVDAWNKRVGEVEE